MPQFRSVIDVVRFQYGIACGHLRGGENRRNTADDHLIQINHTPDLTISPIPHSFL